MSEPEASVPAIERDDLRVDRFVKRSKDRFLGETGHRRKQTPLEPPPEHGCCDEHRSAMRVEPRNPSSDALGQRVGDDRVDVLRKAPHPLRDDQGIGGEGGREQLLHQERDTVDPRRECHDLAGNGRGAEA